MNMRKMVKNFRVLTAMISLLLVCGTICTGCGKDLTEAESAVKAYLMAISGFNLDAMQSCLSEGTNEDFGVDTAVFESSYVQTDTYKKAVESMFKSLSGTVEFTINSSEEIAKDTVSVGVTVKCANVEKSEVDEYMQAKMDEYTTLHPELQQKTALDQNDIGITVMADAYNEFVQLQPKTSTFLDIVVKKINGSWKIVNGEENADLKKWLSDVYGTF